MKYVKATLKLKKNVLLKTYYFQQSMTYTFKQKFVDISSKVSKHI